MNMNIKLKWRKKGTESTIGSKKENREPEKVKDTQETTFTPEMIGGWRMDTTFQWTTYNLWLKTLTVQPTASYQSPDNGGRLPSIANHVIWFTFLPKKNSLPAEVSGTILASTVYWANHKSWFYTPYLFLFHHSVSVSAMYSGREDATDCSKKTGRRWTTNSKTQG